MRKTKVLIPRQKYPVLKLGMNVFLPREGTPEPAIPLRGILLQRKKVPRTCHLAAAGGRRLARGVPLLLLILGMFCNILAFAQNIASGVGKVNEGAGSGSVGIKMQSSYGIVDRSDKGYMCFVPGDIPIDDLVAVLVCLPGVGVTAKQDITNWSSIAQKKDFMVLDMDVGYQRIISFSDIDALYSRIINTVGSLAREYPISKKELYIAGTSAGGMISLALALRYPGKFKAVGVVSGTSLKFAAGDQIENVKGEHLYMVHGAKDQVVPIETFYATKELLEKNGALIEFSVFPDDGHPVNPRGFEQIVEWMSGLDTARKTSAK